jgi:putative PIN family toxin of toxin-antitoxin system
MIRRIVLDTNIYISALYYGGKPRQVLDLASARELQLLISLPLKLELERVLRDKFDLPPSELAANADALWSRAKWIAPQRRLSLCPDEPDNRVLECAMEGHADFIVTGDRHLLNLGPVAKITILKPDAFLALFESHGFRIDSSEPS